MIDETDRQFGWGEALALVGQRIRTLTDFSGVPAGTAGKVKTTERRRLLADPAE